MIEAVIPGKDAHAPEALLIIQARMSSERLPGKVLMSLAGRPMLGVMIDRLADWGESRIIATSLDSSDDAIASFCEGAGIRCFRGSLDDVLGRYLSAARICGAAKNTVIVRLTGDCPLVDSGLVRMVVDAVRVEGYDFATLGPHTGFPRGLDATAFRYELLEKTAKMALSPPDREHVTYGMLRVNPGSSFVEIRSQEDLAHHRITVDELDDFKAVSAIVEAFDGRMDMSANEIIEMLKVRPDIVSINANVQQKAI